MRPGAERNLSGWLVREAVSEISAEKRAAGRRVKADKKKTVGVDQLIIHNRKVF